MKADSSVRSWLPAVLLTLVSVTAHAHDADVIFVELAAGQGGAYAERVTMTAATLGQLAPVDADGDGQLTQADLDARKDALRLGVWEQAKLTPCTRSNETARLEPGYVELTAQFQCAEGELSQEFRWLMVLPSNYRVQMGNQVADSAMRTLHMARPEMQWKTTPLLSVTLSSLSWLAVAAVAGLCLLAVVAALTGRRRLALGLFGVALAVLGFWLAERFLA
jgi:hypothetical protein